MTNIFEDIERSKFHGGRLRIRSKAIKKTIPIVVKEPVQHLPRVTPYYDGGMRLETYGESKLRGFRRAVVRKAPVVARDIISVGKRTIVPAVRDTGKAIGSAILKHGKAQFEDLKRRKAKGENVFW